MQDEKRNDLTAADSPHFTMPTDTDNHSAWEEVDNGRFMPRRVRGSCVGRALG